MFFSKEKAAPALPEPKDFYVPCIRGNIRDVAGLVETTAGIKSFLLLFFKKEVLPKSC